MILFDYNQVAISSHMAHGRGAEVDPGLMRHTILNVIRSNLVSHAARYGAPVIIACDDQNYWRRTIFPHYKAGRRKQVADAAIQWRAIFDTLHAVREEIRENFPYVVMRVPTAEADDIIAEMAENSANRTLVISADKDFCQLLSNSHVDVINPITKKFLRSDDPVRDLKEKIIRGDSGDGIPNVLSDGDTFVNLDKRQKPVTAKVFKGLIGTDPQLYPLKIRDNYIRNESLISFAKIPSEIRKAVIDAYYEAAKGRRSKHGMVFPYLLKSGLINLAENAQDFLTNVED